MERSLQGRKVPIDEFQVGGDHNGLQRRRIEQGFSVLDDSAIKLQVFELLEPGQSGQARYLEDSFYEPRLDLGLRIELFLSTLQA